MTSEQKEKKKEKNKKNKNNNIGAMLFPIEGNSVPKRVETKLELEDLYRILQCDTIEEMQLPRDYVLIFDEDGRYRKSENSCLASHVDNPKFTEIMGTVLLVKTSAKGDYVSVPPNALQELPSVIKEHLENWKEFYSPSGVGSGLGFGYFEARREGEEDDDGNDNKRKEPEEKTNTNEGKKHKTRT